MSCALLLLIVIDLDVVMLMSCEGQARFGSLIKDSGLSSNFCVLDARFRSNEDLQFEVTPNFCAKLEILILRILLS